MIWKLIGLVLGAVFLVALLNFVVAGNYVYLAISLVAAAGAVSFWNFGSR